MLPENSILGELETVTVYNYCDFPMLFSCKNEKNEFYLAILVDEIDFSRVFLYAKIEDIDTLVLLENPKFVATEEYYLYQNLKVYKVIVPESTVTEASLTEVQEYFSEYCEEEKKDQEYFAEFLKRLDERL